MAKPGDTPLLNLGFAVALSVFQVLAAEAKPKPKPKPYLDIPAQNPAVDYLRRIGTESALLLPTQSFPQGEPEINRFLGSSSATLSDSAFLAAVFPGFRKNLIEWSDTVRGHSLFISPAVELSGYGGSQQDTSRSATLFGLGGTLYGELGPRLSFYSHATIYTEFTDKAQFSHQFNPEFGETYSVEKGAGDSLLKERTYNRFESYILADLPWIKLKVGRDHVHTGPGYFSSLMMTRDTPPYYLAEARVDFASWLSLDNYVLRMTDTRHDIQKFANLHRFEFRPASGLSVAFQDIVIYQDRDPDLRYFLPLVPIMFTEANMGGPDNSAMGFDFHYAAVRNFAFWGELFIDDLLGPASFFDDFWENRWAALTGFQVTSPFPKLDLDLVVEYSQVEPWTYNGRQAQTSFKHFNVPSASKLGPDSRSWDFQLTYRALGWIEIREHVELNENGQDRPGTLGMIHDDSVDGQTKELLGGAVRSEYASSTALNLVLKRNSRIGIAYRKTFGDSEGDLLQASFQFAY